MNYVNPPMESPENVIHKTFFSQLLNHEVGYNIYLPPDYGDGNGRYPVAYHLHGWTGNESSDLWPLERIYKNRKAVTVFPNNSPVIEDREYLPIESMVIDELMPHIDKEYRTNPTREERSISGFSMGGGMAFLYAVKHPELFSSVTAYAGTYHHYFPKGSKTVGVAPEKAAELYEEMINEKREVEENNTAKPGMAADLVLRAIEQNAGALRDRLRISLHVGTEDILLCDHEILHLHLTALKIPHEYVKFEGTGHALEKIMNLPW